MGFKCPQAVAFALRAMSQQCFKSGDFQLKKGSLITNQAPQRETAQAGAASTIDRLPWIDAVYHAVPGATVGTSSRILERA